MRPSAQRLQLMRRPPLPKMPVPCRAQWLEDRQSELLDTQYFHAVFTVPEQLPQSPITTRERYMAFCSRSRANLCSPSPVIKHLGAEIGFSPCSTLGALTCFIILIYTCVVPGGGPSGPNPVDFLSGWISCPSRALKAVSSSVSGVFAQSLDAGQLEFFSSLESPDRPSFLVTCFAGRSRMGSTPSGLRRAAQVLDYVGATLIAWRSQ